MNINRKLSTSLFTGIVSFVVVILAAVCTPAISAGSDYGKGNYKGVKKPGFILKYERAPEFIHYDAMEPADFAKQYVAKQPSSAMPYKYKFVDVDGVNIAYLDEGEGDPIIFIHGAPEQSYIWRNIMPYLEPYGRVIAFDLIGHGLSDKPDVEYVFSDYMKYVDGFIRELDLKNVTLVVHDWGSVFGLDYAARHPENVRGIAMMEALVAPFFPIKDKKQASKRKGKAGAVEHYSLYRTPVAWDLAVNQNTFIEQVLQMHTFRELTQREMDVYRDPFRKAEWRKPLFMWARQVSLWGDVPDVEKAMERYNRWLLKKTIPTLDLYAYPGEVSEEYDVRWRTEHVTNHETAFIGVGLHFVQEDQPEFIGRAIADWYRRNLAPDSKVWMTDVQP